MEENLSGPLLNDKKIINGWAIFDWANSAYALVISVAIFPAYFRAVTPDYIEIFGMSLTNSGVYAFAISFAYILLALISPMLSGIADYSGRKKMFLKAFTTLGSLACISMFFFAGELPNSWMLGLLAFTLSTIGFAGGLVFYNSYLPEITTEDKYDQVSAKGYAFGYIGSVLLLIINLIIITFPEKFGISDPTLPARISFVMVGIWWLSFAQITFNRMPNQEKAALDKHIFENGYNEIIKVWSQIKKQPNIKRFLISFFFYSAGVQTVLYLASLFADVELKFDATELIILVLVLQLVAIGGAYAFAYLSKLKGNKFSLGTMLLIWIMICITAYFVTQKMQFYMVAAAVGLVMGGIQSLSRSSYSKLIPAHSEDNTSYFSFYDILEKLAIVFGTFSFGLIEQLTGGMRNSVMTLGLFFVIGFLILQSVSFEDEVTTVNS